MTKQKSNKRALLMSALSLLMCVSMLIGSTFAWITDSVISGNNKIVAGNLDIELEYYNGSAWKSVNGATDLFSKELWEPGHTEVVYLKLSNLGSLALKYQLGINIISETEGTNVDGKTFKLSDYIYMGVVEGKEPSYANREDAVADVNGAGIISTGYTKTGKMLKGDANLYLAVVVYMPESVDNDANYMTGTAAPEIDLGVNLIATQLGNEKDSFGPDYDDTAWADGMKIYSAEDIVSALANGENVVLMNDIAADSLIVISDDAVIDLNGKTLTANLSVAAGAKVVIENGKLDAASPDYSAIETVGNLTLNDVEIESDRHGVRVEGGVTVINDGYYKAAGYAGRTQHAVNVSDGGKVIINGGTFVGPKGTASDSGSAIKVQTGSEVVINGGNFSGGKLKTLSVDGTLTVYGGTFDQDPTAYLASGYTVLDNGDGTFLAYFPQTSFDALLDNAAAGDTVQIPAGTYTFTASKVKEGMVLECAPGTVFKGQSSLNIKGATVLGATFSNPSGSAARNTINGTFKNCTFTGSNALRYCYAGETVVFENCVFDGSVYGIHFDGGANDVLFKNCTFSGFNAMGGQVTLATFDGCTFEATGKSGYNGINLWGDTDMIDCTFVFDGSVSSEWVDLCNDNKTVKFTDCVVTDGTEETPISEVVGDYGDGNTIIVDGIEIVVNLAALQAKIDAAAAGTTITFGTNITGDVVLTNGNITIDGRGYKLDGSVNLNGKKGVTLKAIAFDAAYAKRGYDGKGGAKQYALIVTGDNTNKPNAGAMNLVIDGCTFTGTFANGGASIAFTDQGRSSGGSGNVTIKNCTFDTTGAYYDIYAHYTGNGVNGYGDFVIENNTFKTAFTQGGPVYLGRYASSTPVVVKGNTFETVASLADGVYVQDHSNYGVSVNASDNTFAN